MAKKKTELVWVRALTRIQKPDRTWAKQGDVFPVHPDHVSQRSMAKATDDEIAAAQSVTVAMSASEKIADLEARLADAEAGRALMMEAADLLQVDQGGLIDKIKSLADPGKAETK